MDRLINNPGFQHILEHIFLYLDYKDLMVCSQLSNSCSEILEDSSKFWMKKWIMRGLSKKNQEAWTKALFWTKNSYLEKNILWYLKRSLNNADYFPDLPCYINENIVKKLISTKQPKIYNEVTKILRSCCEENKPGYLQIMAFYAYADRNPPLNFRGLTPIQEAARLGHIDIVKVLAPLVDDPNEKDKDGTGPILFAARNNDIALMKFLAPLTNNPNMGNKVGTPIGIAAVNRHRDFERILRAYIRYLKNTPKSITNRDEYSRRRKKIEILV